MELLDAGNDFYSAKRPLISEENNRSHSSYETAINIILEFSKKGVDFIKSIKPKECNKNPLKDLIKKIENDNLMFSKNNEE